MKKQEFLAMSLPYGLKCIGISELHIYNILSVHFGTMNLVRVKPDGGVDFPLHIEHIKPILHPLSDLTKEIEHNGEKFVPIEKLYHLDIMRCDISLFENINIDVVADHIFSNQFLKFTLKLIEWHFDIAGLIEKGEAIDVNTLPENPYK